MSYTLLVRPPALKGTAEIYLYLEKQRTGLGSEFLSALRECFLFIQAHPKGAQIRKTPYRHIMVEGFRYRIVHAIVG